MKPSWEGFRRFCYNEADLQKLVAAAHVLDLDYTIERRRIKKADKVAGPQDTVQWIMVIPFRDPEVAWHEEEVPA